MTAITASFRYVRAFQGYMREPRGLITIIMNLPKILLVIQPNAIPITNRMFKMGHTHAVLIPVLAVINTVIYIRIA